jgi:uncharacterized protein
MITLDALKRFAVGRNFFEPTTLRRALQRLQFVQADPIRSPARAQDLILRHRVRSYRAGDLERRYAELDIEEDFFVIYGFVTRSLHALMHPRSDARVPAADVGRRWPAKKRNQAERLLEFVRERGVVHPREVDEHFSHGKVKNYWGGSSNATTHLMDEMHYAGMLRVVRREKGIRIYAVRERAPGVSPVGLALTFIPSVSKGEMAVSREPTGETPVPQLIDVVAAIYGPLPGASLAYYVRRLRYAVPQWQAELSKALLRAKERLSHARVDGVDWYWPAGEHATRNEVQEKVRLLAPFDPVVHDRARFEMLWNWPYRFEAYTPAPKRKLGYYAMPLLWRDHVIGWANLAMKNGELVPEFGYVTGSAPRDRIFKRELEAELNRMREFLARDKR